MFTYETLIFNKNEIYDKLTPETLFLIEYKLLKITRNAFSYEINKFFNKLIIIKKLLIYLQNVPNSKLNKKTINELISQITDYCININISHTLELCLLDLKDNFNLETFNKIKSTNYKDPEILDSLRYHYELFKDSDISNFSIKSASFKILSFGNIAIKTIESELNEQLVNTPI